jgi:amino acid transporter
MEAASVPTRTFDHLREHSIGLPQVLFQSITHMAPAAAVAYSIYISVPFSQQALALSVLLALVACLCAAVAIGQLAKLEPSAGGLYAYAARSLGPPVDEHGFSIEDAFVFLSVACDAGVAQACKPAPGFGTIARFSIPKLDATPGPFRTSD